MSYMIQAKKKVYTEEKTIINENRYLQTNEIRICQKTQTGRTFVISDN